MSVEKIAILGGGNMGRALIGGLLRRGTRAEHIMVGEAVPAARDFVTKEFGVAASADNSNVVRDASLVVIAVKPQDASNALPPLTTVLQRNHALVLSVMGGIRVASMEKWCGAGIAVVRTMPNRPALVGAGATALFAGSHVSDEDKKRAENIMRAVGETVWVQNEEHLDIVTALSGTGPAYFFFLTEAMTQAGIELGLAPEVARKLSIATLHGSGLLAHGSDGDMVKLRLEITSKAGTTEAAVRVLEAGEFRQLMGRALEAATRRSRELGAQFGSA